MDSQISWIFGHRGYLDIMDIWASWIFEHHIFGHHGYSNIIHILASRIKIHLRHCQCRDVFPNLTFKALALQVPGGHFLIFIYARLRLHIFGCFMYRLGLAALVGDLRSASRGRARTDGRYDTPSSSFACCSSSSRGYGGGDGVPRREIPVLIWMRYVLIYLTQPPPTCFVKA